VAQHLNIDASVVRQFPNNAPGFMPVWSAEPRDRSDLRAAGESDRARPIGAQSGQGGARSSKDDQAVRHVRPHI